jgi:hypothetical protein
MWASPDDKGNVRLKTAYHKLIARLNPQGLIVGQMKCECCKADVKIKPVFTPPGLPPDDTHSAAESDLPSICLLSVKHTT